MPSVNMGGRPPKYNNPDDMQQKIDEYFKSCEGELLTDETGKALLDKYGHPVILDARPPTITGLALALGFATRMSLLNYQGKKEFHDTIARAKSRVEAYTEERLFDKDGTNGAKFSLQNNFKGWNEAVKEAAGAAAAVVKIICDIPKSQPVAGDDSEQSG